MGISKSFTIIALRCFGRYKVQFANKFFSHNIRYDGYHLYSNSHKTQRNFGLQ